MTTLNKLITGLQYEVLKGSTSCVAGGSHCGFASATCGHLSLFQA